VFGEQLRFDGTTFEPERDAVRLTRQWWDVWRVMSDGEWRTLRELAAATGHPEPSVSARLRDFRKARFGGHDVERDYLADGLWRYRLTPNPAVDVSSEPEPAPAAHPPDCRCGWDHCSEQVSPELF